MPPRDIFHLISGGPFLKRGLRETNAQEVVTDCLHKMDAHLERVDERAQKIRAHFIGTIEHTLRIQMNDT